MTNPDILIIGAGAAGLAAAYTLSKGGRKVAILEARGRTGGRIYTLDNDFPFKHVELGAEFIHGNLPVTRQLMHEAGVEYIAAGGEMWRYYEGKLSRNSWNMPGWEELMKKLDQLNEDMTIADFLDRYFSGANYEPLKNWVVRFASGYDTANPAKASAFALRDEWGNEDDDAQYRVDGGYGRLIRHMADISRLNGAEFHLNSIVKHIDWRRDKVDVILSNGNVYSAKKVILALPLGVLQTGGITFEPSLGHYNKAFQQIGFGAIVKILFEFKDAFWEDDERPRMSFVISDEEIPTWWTQYPIHSNVLTGWLGGLPAERKKHLTDKEFVQQGLRSLATIFSKTEAELADDLAAWKVANWTSDPFTLGSYVYDMVESHAARKVLSKPVANKLYFAGEFIYEGPSMGTVEAVLT
ncbi:MAG: FAD-dependent oxidoreductase, partial [Bacteroidetes bacterium]|nr:FAD-dependent oxidoreductase [Bacteroidota bacterium]